MDIEVRAATEADGDLVEALGALIPQLSSSAVAPGPEQVAEMLASPATTLLVARAGPGGLVARAGSGGGDHRREGQVIGCLTLVLFRIPTGRRAWVEDVVVDQEARGRGVGEALTLAAVARARAAGARSVELSSRPSRAAANRLYRRLGFEVRHTNLYRLVLDPP